MKEQLIKLANEKCFLSKLSIILSGIEYIPKTIEKYIEDIEHYLWMCELQKWLRDEKGLLVTINFHYPSFYGLIEEIIIEPKFDIRTKSTNAKTTYTSSLELTCFEALKLLK